MTASTSTVDAPRRIEQGSALVLAIVITVLGIIIIAAMSAMFDLSGDRTKGHQDRTNSVGVIDRALASVEFALESHLTHEGEGFRLSRDALEKLAAMEATSALGSATVVANSTFNADFRSHGLDRTWMGGERWGQSVRHDLDESRSSWWQLVNVIPPGTGTGADATSTLVLYVRTWISTRGRDPRVVTEPRIIRAELRPGRFSDYQILVDGPLVMASGAQIRGRIHTNGYPDAYLIDSMTTPNQPLVLGSASGLPECFPGASFSTANGTISGSCTGFAAPRDVANGRRIDLLRGREHLRVLKSMCGSVVFCPAGSPPWNVNLSTARVNGAAIPASALAVYVEGDVVLSGRTTRALTIGVATDPARVSAFGSASVTLAGPGVVGSAGTSTVSQGIVGLIVEGDVIPRLRGTGNCPTGLNAAVISSSGALAIPPEYRTPEAPGGATPACDTPFTVNGSLSTHYAGILYIAWEGIRAGYERRDYRYDSRLRTNPPPLFPLTGPWQVSSWKDAMPECLTAANRNRSSCG